MACKEINVTVGKKELNLAVEKTIVNYSGEQVDINAGEGIRVDGEFPSFTITNISEGNTDHSELDNLDYADSGHTGFQPALIAGTNINITDNTISATDTTYSSGDFNLSSLGDVDDTDKAEGKILQVDSLGKHIYVTNAGGSDEKVKYDSNDTAAGYLSEKILAGTGISLSEGTGTDENKLVITNTGGGATYLVDLGDVVNTDKATGKILQVNADGDHEYVDLPDPDLSGLVPYTGATTKVDLGDNSLKAINLETNYVLYNHDVEVEYPSDFNWVPPVKIYRDMNTGIYHTDYKSEDYMVTGKAYYLDSINGNDANDGSEENPFKTLSYVLTNKTDYDVLYLKAGDYTWGSKILTKTCSIIGVGGKARISNKLPFDSLTFTDLSSTKGEGVWGVSSSAGNVKLAVDLGNKIKGISKRLVVASGSDTQQYDTEDSILVGASSANIRFTDNRDVSDYKNIEYYDSVNSPRWNGAGTLFIKNLSFEGGLASFWFTGQSGSLGVFENTDFLYATSTNNFSFASTGGTVILKNCISAMALADGFSYHNDGYAVEIDCVSLGNGYNGAVINNATTAHEGMFTIRINGKYYGSSRTVHDVSMSSNMFYGGYIGEPDNGELESLVVGIASTPADTTRTWLYGTRINGTVLNNNTQNGLYFFDIDERDLTINVNNGTFTRSNKFGLSFSYPDYLIGINENLTEIIEDLVPYTGATGDVDLGANDLVATDITSEGNLKILNDKYIQGRNALDNAEVDILKVNTDDEVEAGADFNFGLLDFSTITEPISPDAESTYMYQEATGTRPNRTISLLTKNELGEKVIITTTIV